MNPITAYYFLKHQLNRVDEAVREVTSAPGRAIDKIDQCTSPGRGWHVDGPGGILAYEGAKLDLLCLFYDHRAAGMFRWDIKRFSARLEEGRNVSLGINSYSAIPEEGRNVSLVEGALMCSEPEVLASMPPEEPPPGQCTSWDLSSGYFWREFGWGGVRNPQPSFGP